MTVLIIIGLIFLAFGFVVFFGAPYVPSHKRAIERIFDEIGVGPRDVVVDIGSGDGVVLRLAARRGARAIGYEINPLLVALSRILSLQFPRIRIELANFWRVTFPKNTTIVYIFSVSRDGKKLTRKLQKEADRLGRPLKLVCYGSPLHGKAPDKIFEAYHLYTFHPLHLPQAQV